MRRTPLLLAATLPALRFNVPVEAWGLLYFGAGFAFLYTQSWWVFAAGGVAYAAMVHWTNKNPNWAREFRMAFDTRLQMRGPALHADAPVVGSPTRPEDVRGAA